MPFREVMISHLINKTKFSLVFFLCVSPSFTFHLTSPSLPVLVYLYSLAETNILSSNMLVSLKYLIQPFCCLDSITPVSHSFQFFIFSNHGTFDIISLQFSLIKFIFWTTTILYAKQCARC